MSTVPTSPTNGGTTTKSPTTFLSKIVDEQRDLILFYAGAISIGIIVTATIHAAQLELWGDLWRK